MKCSDDEGNNTWPEILKFLFDCANSGNNELKESALIIFRLVKFLAFCMLLCVAMCRKPLSTNVGLFFREFICSLHSFVGLVLRLLLKWSGIFVCPLNFF